jgi:hypothetical protein
MRDDWRFSSSVAGQYIGAVVRMDVARVQVDDDRKASRQDLLDTLHQKAVELIAPCSFELQERPGIDRQADEIESGAAQQA